jgi:hypothetical protein
MQCACAVWYCLLWPVRLYRIFPHYLLNGTIFGGGGGMTEHIMCVKIFPTGSACNIFHSTNNSARQNCKCTQTDLQVKYSLCLADFNETWIFFGRFFEKLSNFKFYENPCSEGRVVLCGQTDGHKEVTIVFHNSANAPKNVLAAPHRQPQYLLA